MISSQRRPVLRTIAQSFREADSQHRSRMENTSCVKKALPFVAMVLLNFLVIGSSTLSKAAMMSGLSQYVYLVYYDVLGTIILLPFFLHRRLSHKALPITFSLLCRFFGLSLIGRCLFPIFVYTGLNYTSVTVGAAIANLTPIFTYLIAICSRVERLDLRKSIDQIKTVGTIVSVSGALVVILYKGPALMATHHDSSSSDQNLLFGQSKWPLGCLLFTLGSLLRSVWNIFQADTAKLYPDEVTIVFFCSLFRTIQTGAASYFLVEGPSSWKLNHSIEIIAIVYSAFSLSAVMNVVLTWCLRKKGPVFVSMFDPLSVATAGFMGFVFLGDGIYLGSVVGSATIVVGFYAVMWGQAKMASPMVNKIGSLESGSDQVAPLLKNSHS